MILRFEFSNHTSYRDTQIISWVASPLKHLYRTPFACSGVDDGVLPCCAVYGANASGKSNALKAFQFFIRSIRSSFRMWEPGDPIPRSPFLGGSPELAKESRYQIDFVQEGVQYQYGFALTDEEVLEEWLDAYPTPRKQSWFQREKGAAIKFGQKLKGPNRSIEELTRKNALFLSVAATHGHESLGQIHSWLSNFYRFDLRDQRSDPYRRHGVLDADRAEQLLPMIQAADLGIVGVEEEFEERTIRIAATEQSTSELPSSESTRTVKIPRLRFVHQLEDKQIGFPLHLESDGTQVYLSRLSMLRTTLEHGGMYVVDEIDRSLHPALCLQIIKLFLSPKTNPKGAQILFTTHDTSILSSGDLRRDEVWFAEKSRDGASTLYPLSDFSPRKAENLERGYLQGRYGGVPLLNPATFWSAFHSGSEDESK